MEPASTMSFPVVAFVRQSVPCLVKDVRQFSICPVATLKEGLEGTMIVDSRGVQYVICTATKKGFPKPFFGFSLFCKRTVLIDITVDRTGESISVQGLKALLLSRTLEGFAGHSDRATESEEIEKLFAACESIPEVMRAYSAYLGIETGQGL